jgi:hypothetical protein
LTGDTRREEAMKIKKVRKLFPGAPKGGLEDKTRKKVRQQARKTWPKR